MWLKYKYNSKKKQNLKENKEQQSTVQATKKNIEKH